MIAKTTKPTIRSRYRGTAKFGGLIISVAAVTQVTWTVILISTGGA